MHRGPSIAADLLEFTDRTERSRSVHAQTARASAARDSPRREPRTRRDLEPPKLCSSEENPTEQAPTLDILADCLDHIHQIRCHTRLVSTSEQSSSHIHCSRENELEGNTKKIARRESFRSTEWKRISDGEEQRAAVARHFPHQHDLTAGHERRNSSCARLTPASTRSSTRKSDGLHERADIDPVAAKTFAEFERDAENWNTNVGAIASPHECQGYAAHISSTEVARRIDLLPTVEEEDLLDDRGEKANVNDSEFPRRCGLNLLSVDDHQSSDCHDADNKSFATEEEGTNPEIRRSADSLRVTAGPMVYDAAGAIDSPSYGSRVSATSSLRFGSIRNEASTVNNSRDNGGAHCLSSVSFDKTPEARDGNPRENSRLALTTRKSNCLALSGAFRTKTVRFLLGGNEFGEKPPALMASRNAGTEARLNPHGPFSRQAVVDGKHKMCWTCAGCGKRNGEGSVLCSVCGRRGDTSHTDNSHSNNLMSKSQTRFRPVDSGRVPQALRTVRERSVSRGRTASPRGLERVEAKDSFRGAHAAGYGLSSYAKMKQTTEKAVTARLSLTAEIKSLLSLVRGRRG